MWHNLRPNRLEKAKFLHRNLLSLLIPIPCPVKITLAIMPYITVYSFAAMLLQALHWVILPYECVNLLSFVMFCLLLIITVMLVQLLLDSLFAAVLELRISVKQ